MFQLSEVVHVKGDVAVTKPANGTPDASVVVSFSEVVVTSFAVPLYNFVPASCTHRVIVEPEVFAANGKVIAHSPVPKVVVEPAKKSICTAQSLPILM